MSMMRVIARWMDDSRESPLAVGEAFWMCNLRDCEMRVGTTFRIQFGQGDEGLYKIVKVADLGSKA